MGKVSDLYESRPSRVALFFGLLVTAFVVSSWALMLSPAPVTNPNPDWIEGWFGMVGWAVGLLTFVLMCSTKLGRRLVSENSKGKLIKKVFLFFGMPVLVALLALLTIQAAISGLAGTYISLRGEPLTVTGEIVSKSYSESRGCRFRTDIRWFPNSSVERHCYSEELWAHIKVGQEVSQKRWQLSSFYAHSHFVWPKTEIPTAA